MCEGVCRGHDDVTDVIVLNQLLIEVFDEVKTPVVPLTRLVSTNDSEELFTEFYMAIRKRERFGTSFKGHDLVYVIKKSHIARSMLGPAFLHLLESKQEGLGSKIFNNAKKRETTMLEPKIITQLTE